MKTEATLSELLADRFIASDGGQYLQELWPETRAVIEAAAAEHEHDEEDVLAEFCDMCDALAAWRKRAAEVLS